MDAAYRKRHERELERMGMGMVAVGSPGGDKCLVGQGRAECQGLKSPGIEKMALP